MFTGLWARTPERLFTCRDSLSDLINTCWRGGALIRLSADPSACLEGLRVALQVEGWYLAAGADGEQRAEVSPWNLPEDGSVSADGERSAGGELTHTCTERFKHPFDASDVSVRAACDWTVLLSVQSLYCHCMKLEWYRRDAEQTHTETCSHMYKNE